MDRWVATVEPRTGMTFYVNEETGETAWKLPPGAAVAGTAAEEETDSESDGELAPALDFTTRAGFLFKAPPSGGRWKKRWFVADRTTRKLVWYAGDPAASAGHSEPKEAQKGSLTLDGTSIRRSRGRLPAGAAAPAEPPHKNELFIVTPGRTVHLCCPSAMDANGWAGFLEQAAGGLSAGAVGIRPGGGRADLESAAAAETITARRLAAPAAVGAWLHVYAPDGHKWDERFARLAPEPLTFSYYTGEDDGARCCRVVDLRSATLIPGCADAADPSADATLRRSPGFRLVVHGIDEGSSGERQLVFVTPDRREAQTWVDAIHTAQAAGDGSAAAAPPHGSGTAAVTAPSLVFGTVTTIRVAAPGPRGPASKDPFERSPSPGGTSTAVSPSSAVRAALQGAGPIPPSGPPPSAGGAAAAGSDEAPCSAHTRRRLLRDMPVVEGSLFKSGPDGTKWKERSLVLVPHASKLGSAPGVTEDQCPCIAYYGPASRSKGKPKGVIHLPDVGAAHLRLPLIAGRTARFKHGLTLVTDRRRYCFCSRLATEPGRWMDALEEVAAAWNHGAGASDGMS